MRVVLLDGEGHPTLTLTTTPHGIRTITRGRQSKACAGTLDEVTAMLGELAPPGTPLVPVVPARPRPERFFDALLLIALSARWPFLAETTDLCSFRQHHLTLAYALPLALDARWRAWAADHAELLIRGRQLVAVPASDLVAVAPDGQAGPRHRRLLRRHARTEVTQHGDHARFLDQWSAFTTWRYGRPLPAEERAALHALLAMSGCVVREFAHAGETIAHCVVCLHDARRVAFDLMAAWHPRHARLRPGIFSAVHNLTDATQRAWRFSLCYGQFPYKDEIVGTAPRLTLEDLLYG